MRAADVMQKDVMSVSPELPLAEFEEFLISEEIGGVPVIGTQGQVEGIASKTDIVRALSAEGEAPISSLVGSDLTVADIMTREVLVVASADDVRDVARRMIDAHVHRVLVCDGEEVVGILTTFDLLQAVAR
jgi:CBS domain-containing protein